MPQDINQSFDIPLHDIKTIVEIQEYSFYYFLGVSFIAILLTCGLVYFLYRWLKQRDRYNERAVHYKAIKKLKLDDSKQTAYMLTLLGATFKDDSPRHSEMFIKLTRRLDEYKYKKNVKQFDSEVRSYIETYKGMIDV